MIESDKVFKHREGIKSAPLHPNLLTSISFNISAIANGPGYKRWVCVREVELHLWEIIYKRMWKSKICHATVNLTLWNFVLEDMQNHMPTWLQHVQLQDVRNYVAVANRCSSTYLEYISHEECASIKKIQEACTERGDFIQLLALSAEFRESLTTAIKLFYKQTDVAPSADDRIGRINGMIVSLLDPSDKKWGYNMSVVKRGGFRDREVVKTILNFLNQSEQIEQEQE